MEEAYDSKTDGQMINSGAFDGTPVSESFDKVADWLEEDWPRAAPRQLPPARLVDQPPTNVGCAHPDHLL